METVFSERKLEEQIQVLLTEFCKTALSFASDFTINGLISIRLDGGAISYVVNVNSSVTSAAVVSTSGRATDQSGVVDVKLTDDDLMTGDTLISLTGDLLDSDSAATLAAYEVVDLDALPGVQGHHQMMPDMPDDTDPPEIEIAFTDQGEVTTGPSDDILPDIILNSVHYSASNIISDAYKHSDEITSTTSAPVDTLLDTSVASPAAADIGVTQELVVPPSGEQASMCSQVTQSDADVTMEDVRALNNILTANNYDVFCDASIVSIHPLSPPYRNTSLTPPLPLL